MEKQVKIYTHRIYYYFLGSLVSGISLLSIGNIFDNWRFILAAIPFAIFCIVFVIIIEEK